MKHLSQEQKEKLFQHPYYLEIQRVTPGVIPDSKQAWGILNIPEENIQKMVDLFPEFIENVRKGLIKYFHEECDLDIPDHLFTHADAFPYIREFGPWRKLNISEQRVGWLGPEYLTALATRVAKHNAAVADWNDVTREDAVQVLYHYLMDRLPDRAGKEFWVGVLEKREKQNDPVALGKTIVDFQSSDGYKKEKGIQ